MVPGYLLRIVHAMDVAITFESIASIDLGSMDR